jgi:hypothetical protein
MAFRSVSIVASDTSIITAEGHHRESGSNQPALLPQHSSANQSLRHAQLLPGTKHQHADPVIGQAGAKANGEIDQVNADVTQAYSIANGMATGSCASDGPGRPPVPIGHILSN